jgi:2-methylcitrate dehydratase PrpD
MSALAPAGSITRTLAEFAVGTTPGATEPTARHEAVRIFVDTIGCAIAGLITAPGQIAAATVVGERGPLEATVVGHGPATLGAAAYANTALNNGLDFEPVGPEGHVSAVAVPVALAVAEALDASGEELLAGLIAGLRSAEPRTPCSGPRPRRGGSCTSRRTRCTTPWVSPATAPRCQR